MKAKVTANGVRLYESNSTISGAKGFAKYGTELDIEAEYGGWCKLTDGRWIEACFTEAIEVSGGGASSWNDLEDKPFGDGEPSTVWIDYRAMTHNETVIDCQTVVDYDSEETVPNAGVSKGDIFRVTIDEELIGEYEVEDFYENGTMFVIGNPCLYKFTFENTGDSFLFCFEGTKVSSYFDDYGTHEVYLRKKQKINQIPKKYLPKAKSVTYAAGDTPTKAEFDALISSLCSAGYLEYPPEPEDEEE